MCDKPGVSAISDYFNFMKDFFFIEVEIIMKYEWNLRR